MIQRRQLPPRLLEPPPDVGEGLALLMDCFWDLARPSGRIPWSEIEAWCRAHELDEELSGDVHHVVKRLDVAYQTWLHKRGQRKKSGETVLGADQKDAEAKKTRVIGRK